MIYYIFKAQIFTLFLSINHFSAISFPSKIYDYVGGNLSDFKVYELNKKKSLVFETKSKFDRKNFLTFLKEDKYHFNLIYNEVLSNKDIEIHAAEKCVLFSLLKETKHYKLFECPKSLYFVNLKARPVRVNEMTIDRNSYLSKGPPVFLNGRMIYYQGRAL